MKSQTESGLSKITKRRLYCSPDPHFYDLSSISKWLSTRVILPTRGHLTMSGEIFSCLNCGEIATGSKYKPGMLLNILQYAGQSPTTKNYLAEDVKSAEVETL